MQGFQSHTGVMMPLLRDNVDTDVIIPSREMRTVSKTGLLEGLFAPWRYLQVDERVPNTDFPMNQSSFNGASILLAGTNFGCGSSREHAVWALMEAGFRVVIAESFATIFFNNALRNGLLPVALSREALIGLMEWCAIDPQVHRPTVDLQTGTVEAGHQQIMFEMASDARTMLLSGLDEIGLTEQNRDAIETFENQDRQRRPWIYLDQR